MREFIAPPFLLAVPSVLSGGGVFSVIEVPVDCAASDALRTDGPGSMCELPGNDERVTGCDDLFVVKVLRYDCGRSSTRIHAARIE